MNIRMIAFLLSILGNIHSFATILLLDLTYMYIEHEIFTLFTIRLSGFFIYRTSPRLNCSYYHNRLASSTLKLISIGRKNIFDYNSFSNCHFGYTTAKIYTCFWILPKLIQFKCSIWCSLHVQSGINSGWDGLISNVHFLFSIFHEIDIGWTPISKI